MDCSFSSVFLKIFVFLFGICFGSFYNVVIYRLPMGLPITKGRSMCFSCKHELGFFDLFPVLSYLFLGGKCRYCKAKISPRYMLVELLTGLIFLFTFIKFNLSLKTLLLFSFFSMLIIVFFIDYDTMEIYDIILIIFSSLNLLILILINKDNLLNLKDNFYGLILGFGIYYTIYIIAKLIYKKEAFGFGDCLLNAAIGLVLGFKLAFLTSFLSFFVSIIIIIVLAILGKQFKIKKEIPFGPYMCISAFISIFYGNDLIRMYFEYYVGN